MIIIFFILNMIIFLGVSLATSMFGNHLKGISKSIDIYLDPKAYKPKSQMQFISSLVDKYRGYESEQAMEQGIDVLINDCFYKQKIGAFNLSTIDTIAHKGKQLLWCNMMIMVFFEGLTTGLGESMIHSVLMISSGGLGLVLIFFQLYKNIDLEKEKLFIKVKNYLHHTYPHLKARQKEQGQVSVLINKIDALKSKIEKLEQTNQQDLKEDDLEQANDQKEKKIDLVEEDIIQLIEYFVSPN